MKGNRSKGSVTPVLRRFEEKDAEGIREIYSEFFEDRPELRSEEGFIVAEIGGRIVGFVVVTTHMTYPWWDREVKSWCEIEELHVHHEFWRRGMGTQLVLKSTEYAESKGVEAVYVTTGVDNLPARKLYENFGFKEYEHKIRYKKSLK